MTYEYVRSERRVPCWGCEKLTQRVSVAWEAHICSAECKALVDERVGRELFEEAELSEDAQEEIRAGLEDAAAGRVVRREKPKTLMDQLLDSIEQAGKDRHG